MTRPVVQINTMSGWYGGEYQVLKLVEGLTRRGRSTVLLANGAGALYRKARAAGLPAVPLPPIVCRRWCPGGRFVIRHLLSGRRPILFHAHDSRALRLAPRPDSAADAPVVLGRRVPSPFRGSVFSQRRYEPDRVAAIIAVSHAVKRILVASGIPDGQVSVVPSGTDLRLLDAAVPDVSLAGFAHGRVRVGGVGELTKKKNWAMLVRVAAELKRRGCRLIWFVAGDGPERRALLDLARRCGVEDDVRLLGFREDIESFVKGLDILLHVSRAEGTPGAVRMAMLAGVPVVAVNTPGTVETLGGCGIAVGLDDDPAAASAVESLARDTALRSRMAEEAMASSRGRFDIDATVEATEVVYDDVLRRQEAADLEGR
jgi:glycosyltransferase involved in cell wall biosynthesis